MKSLVYSKNRIIFLSSLLVILMIFIVAFSFIQIKIANKVLLQNQQLTSQVIEQKFNAESSKQISSLDEKLFISIAVVCIVFSILLLMIIIILLTKFSKNINNLKDEILRAKNHFWHGEISKRADIKNVSTELKPVISDVNLLLDGFEKIMNQIPILFFIGDKDNNIKFINVAGIKFLKAKKDEIVGAKCYDLFNTINCKTDDCISARCIKYGEIFHSFSVVKIKDNPIEVELHGIPLYNQFDEYVATINIIIDKTDLNFAHRKANEVFDYQNKETKKILEILNLISHGDFSQKYYASNVSEVTKELESTYSEISRTLNLAIDSISKNIEERKKADDSVIKSEVELRSLFSVMKEVIIEIDRDGRYVNIAPTSEELLYQSRNEMLGKTIFEILPEDVAKRQYEKISAALESDGIMKVVYELTISGKSHWFEARITKKSENTVLYLAIDITDQKHKEMELKKLSQAVEQSPSLTVMTDLEGIIEYVNPKFSEITGYTHDEVIGKNVSILTSKHFDSKYFNELWDTIHSGREWRGELCNERKDGEIYWESAIISPLFDDEGNEISYIKVAEDITEQRLLRESLINAKKMESIGNLAGGIAHDFNNLLTVIHGYTEIGIDDSKSDKILKKYFSEIADASDRGQKMIDQLLAFSSKQIYQPKIVDPKTIINNLSTILRDLIGRGIFLKVNLYEDCGLIKADSHQVEQILVNVIQNARDAIKMVKDREVDNTIIIKCERIFVDRIFSSHNNDFEVGDYTLFSITDNGIGMTDEIKEKMFEPFFTTKEFGTGKGLGLSTVFGILKQNDAVVLVDTKFDKGTTINIYWPISDINQIEDEETEDVEISTSAKVYTVLYAEDEPIVRTIGETFLETLGYNVISAENGEEAMKLAKETENIDILFTDILMPKMDGFQLSQEIVKIFPDIKILFASGYTKDIISEKGLMKEDVNFLSKPYKMKELASAMRTTLL